MSLNPPYTASTLFARTSLDLPPEILCWVGNNLTSADLAACVQVSREWHTLFCPFLYNVLDLRRPLECKQDPPVNILSDVFGPRAKDWERYRKMMAAPCMGAFLQYQFHIKHLVVDEKLEISSWNNIQSRFTSLIDLRLECNSLFFERDKDKGRFSFMILFTKNPGLQVLDLYRANLSQAAEFSQIAESCPHLTKLQLEGCFLDLLDFAKGLKTCRSLLSLSIRRTYMNSDENHPLQDATLAPALKELNLSSEWGDASQQIYDLTSRSELKSLELDLGGDPDRSAKVRLNQCKNLLKLTIKNVKEDKEVSEILDSCQKALEELSIEDCEFGDRTMESARRHFEALKTFRLKGIDKVTTIRLQEWPAMRSRMIAERKLTDIVIRSCPNLAYLECPRLESTALLPRESECSSWNYELDAGREVESSPEQSIGLKTLKVGSMARGNWVAAENDQMLEPFPTMKHLETLVLSQITVLDYSECRTKLDSRFGSGGEYNRSRMSRDERLRWMLQWWPKLTSFVNGNGL
ncbi:hypothetical protein EMPS_06513 [Entomortierella parvispora]|uniref:F-box domain-containing protein n=1 Tax=Entomortierella parvispora TaxID=205924 RepID=A0A9P3LXT6_9FUNG|nr:hypothetical protein EMPS_06513 [Entomortierella parvispora]